MANINLLYGTWMLNKTINVNVNVSIDFTCISNESEMEWDKLYGISNVELAYSKNSSTWIFPYRTDDGWSIESARTIKVSTESNSNALSWLQTNAVKLSDDLNYTNSVNKYNDIMNELNDVINEKANSYGKKTIEEILTTAKSIEIGSSGEDTLKKLLDYTKSCRSFFMNNTDITDLSDVIKYHHTENVTNMEQMFYACSNLLSIPAMNTSNVINLEQAFGECQKLLSVPQLNTSKVNRFDYAFSGCKAIKNIPDLDVSSATKVSNLFSNCTALLNPPKLLNFEKNNATSTEKMFWSCESMITEPKYDTSKITKFDSMFGNCKSLKEITVLDMSSATSANDLFWNCKILERVPDNLDFSKMTKATRWFSECNSLTEIPALNTDLVTYWYFTFSRCHELKKIDISHYHQTSSYTFFTECHSLKALIIRSFGDKYAIGSNPANGCYHILGTVNATYNPEGLKDGYIYVPRNMVDTLKSATNWSTYADQIRALEDYTVDGTTTGELDESKI